MSTTMKFIVSDHLLCKVHRKNRKGQPFKDCRKKKSITRKEKYECDLMFGNEKEMQDTLDK
jgi:hypothetical protein